MRGGERKLMNEKKVDFLGEEPTYKKGGIIMVDKMKLKMKKVMKNEKGMTLIELLAVLVIIAIVALIAVPAIGNIINNSHDKAIISSAVNIMDGAKIARTNGDCDATCDQDTLKEYVDGVDGTYTVDYNSSNKEYTVKYSKLNDIKGSKFSEYKKDSLTSAEIKKALGGASSTNDESKDDTPKE